MGFCKVFLTSSAKKELRKIPASHIKLLIQKIASLSQNPRPTGTQLLKGNNRYYRIRLGDYRVVYEINDTEQIVTIIKIGHRREIYD